MKLIRAIVLLFAPAFLLAQTNVSNSAGTVTVTQSTAANLKVDLSGTAANTTAVKVDGSAVTQPVRLAAFTATVVSSTSATAVAATAATLRKIVVGTGVASGTIKLFDLASASCTGTPSTNPKGTLTMPVTIGNPFFVEFDATFSNGICVLESSASFVATFIFN